MKKGLKEVICIDSCYVLYLRLLQDLMERLDSLLCGDGSESLKSLCLKLLLCLVTVRQNIYHNSQMNYNEIGFGECFLCC